MKIRLKRHAYYRLMERTSIREEKVKEVFSLGNYVKYAQDPYKENCFHYVFLVEGFNQPFIAVVDDNSREVITFLNYDKCRYKVPSNIKNILEDIKEENKKKQEEKEREDLLTENCVKTILHFKKFGSFVFDKSPNFVVFTALMLIFFDKDFISVGIKNSKKTNKYLEKTNFFPKEAQKIIDLYFYSKDKRYRKRILGSLKVNENKFKDWINNGSFFEEGIEGFKRLSNVEKFI